jgi:hypothetical protein
MFLNSINLFVNKIVWSAPFGGEVVFSLNYWGWGHLSFKFLVFLSKDGTSGDSVDTVSGQVLQGLGAHTTRWKALLVFRVSTFRVCAALCCDINRI